MTKCKYPNEVCTNMTVLNGETYCDSVPCSLKDELPKQTNADRIRSMSDEELAEFIGKFLESMSDCENCPAKTEVFLCVSCADEILDWLRKGVDE